MSRRRLVACCLTLLGVVGGLAACYPAPSGTTYYVSSTGRDRNSGTSTSSPWKTINRVNQANLGPGDTVRFRGGASYSGTLFLAQEDGGTAASPVTIESYDGRATINGQDASGIFAYDIGGVAIRNLNVVGSGASTNAGEGIGVYNDLSGDVLLSGITIADVNVTGFARWGVIVGSDVGRSGYQNVRIERSQVHDNGLGGVLVWGPAVGVNRNVYVGSVRAYRNLGKPDGGRNTGSGIVLGSVNGGTVEHSVAYENGGQNALAGEGPVGIWVYDSNRVVLQFNESYGNRTGTNSDGGGFNLDQNTSNSVLQYNYSHGNAGPGLLLAQRYNTTAHTGNVVRYNISYDDARRGGTAGLMVWGAVRNAEVYHNTVYLPGPFVTGQRAVKVWNSGSTPGDTYHVHLRNNIVVARGGSTPLLEVTSGQLNGSVDLRFQGNDWFTGATSPRWIWGATSYYSLSAWRSATGQEKVGSTSVGRNVDPLLVAPGFGDAGHQLRSGSPLVDAGVDLYQFSIAAGGRDYFGGRAPLGARPDIGAHELR